MFPSSSTISYLFEALNPWELISTNTYDKTRGAVEDPSQFEEHISYSELLRIKAFGFINKVWFNSLKLSPETQSAFFQIIHFWEHFGVGSRPKGYQFNLNNGQ